MKKIIDLIISYKFYIFILLFYEFLYVIFGYKGNGVNIRNNDKTTDTIPCPYLFLAKMLKDIKDFKINSFTDIGCGNGRVIFFFKKHFDANYYGYELFEDAYKQCLKIFADDSKVKINNEDFFKSKQKTIISDCYFINDPIKNEELHADLFGNMVENHIISGKKVYYISVNLSSQKSKIFKNCIMLNSFKVGSRGYQIFSTK